MDTVCVVVVLARFFHEELHRGDDGDFGGGDHDALDLGLFGGGFEDADRTLKGRLDDIGLELLRWGPAGDGRGAVDHVRDAFDCLVVRSIS